MYDEIEEKAVILPPFKHFIMSVGEIPSSYLESMTYYEMLVWFTNYLGKTVIPAINENGEAVIELQNLFVTLQNYVNDYFTNLDVQEEINNKLDDMTEDGSLQRIVGQYIRSDIIPLIEEQNEEIDEFKNDINSDIDDLTARVNGIASGTPIPVSSITDMVDTTKVYLLTTDGYWYYYDGDSWEQGGVYQASQIDNDNLAIDGRNTKTSNLAYYYGYEEFKPIGEVYTFEYGDLSGTTGNEIVLSSHEYRKRTASPIEIDSTEFLTINNMSNGYISYRVFIVDSENIIKGATSWKTDDITLFNKYNGNEVKYYLLVQITGHYNWDVTTYELSKIRILRNQINRQNYLHSLFNVNVYQMSTSNDDMFESSTRCLSDFIHYNGKIKIKLSSPYNAMILQYNKSTKAFIHTETGWVGDVLYYTFSPNYLYKIQFRKSDNSSLTPTNVIDNVNIYPIEQMDSTINYNFSNMILNNHQGYSSEYSTGMNLADSYYNSFKQGYKYAECDVRFTLDNVPVCSHDASFVDGETTVVIAETNYADLIEYDYYEGNHISSLDSVMANCKKYGLTLQLDQLSGDWSDTEWNNLFAVIDKYQMREYVMYSAGNQTLITKVLSYDSKARCIMNISNLDNLTPSINLAHTNKNGKNKFILAINHSLITADELATLNGSLEEDIYAGVWTIDTMETLLSYLPYAYMITTNKITPSDIINEFVH